MKTAVLTAYVMIWPILSALVLAALTAGVLKDIRRAKRRGEDLV